jgi:hypothetical protein
MANEEEQTQLEEFRCREQMDNPLGHPTNIMGWRIGTLNGSWKGLNYEYIL